ncbi:unnamed protein product, partial [Didymodactylos carnosus]
MQETARLFFPPADVIRPALGRAGFLGSLYDLRRDTFVTGNIFKKELTDDVVNITHTNEIDFTYDHENNFSSILKTLNVKGDFKINILCSLTATHVVTRIRWGANILLSFETDVHDESNRRQIEANLKVSLEKLGPIASVDTLLDVKGMDDKAINFERIRIKIAGDIKPETLPSTVIEAAQLISQVPRLIEKINRGKGKQLEFTLCPIDEVSRQLGVHRDFRISTHIRSIDNALIRLIEQEFDELLRDVQQTNRVIDAVNDFSEFLPAKECSAVRRQK